MVAERTEGAERVGVMAKIRHIAICAQDTDKMAEFYKTTFGMQEVARLEKAVFVTDGYINLALLPAEANGGQEGIYHFGFQVDDIAATQKKIEALGGKFFFDLGSDQEKENFERKFKDPDGIIFDISKKGWLGTK